MSEVVEGADLLKMETRGRRPSYDWDLWFDGRVHRLLRGDDYPENVPPKNFRSTVYSAARSRGLEVHTRILDGDLHVQAVPVAPKLNGHTPERQDDSQRRTRVRRAPANE